MGKLVGAVKYIGKMNDTVGYKSSAAAKSDETFVRAYTNDIKNPRSAAQARQRAKTVPAQIFYGAFEPVLNHAFIPKGNKARNRAMFLKYAMSLNEIPDVMKGEAKIPFVEYTISKGSLGVSGKTIGTYRGGDTVAFEGLKLDEVTTDKELVRAMTVAAFSTDVLAENPELIEGEEITILAVLVDRNDPTQRIAVYGSIVLDKGNVLTTIGDCIPSTLAIYKSTAEGLQCSAYDDEAWGLLSVGLIISSRNGSSWQYTNSKMYQSAYAIDGFDWDEETIIASYMDTASEVGSEKILQQADNSASGLVIPVSVANETYTMSPAIPGATYTQTTAAVVTMSDGSKRVVTLTKTDKTLVNAADGQFTGISKTVDNVTTPVYLSETTWGAMRTIAASDVSF